MSILHNNIIGIAASTKEGVIGTDNYISWKYPLETKHFQNYTKGQTLVMGRQTYENLPNSLLNKRRYIVFTQKLFLNRKAKPNVEFVFSMSNFIDIVKMKYDEDLYIIGGSKIFDLFFKHNLIKEFILTVIHKNYTGNKKLNIDYLNTWGKNCLLKTDNYNIYQLINNH
jgi:dihydrofolate reductase